MKTPPLEVNSLLFDIIAFSLEGLTPIKQSFIFRGLRFVKHYYKFMLLNDNRFNLSFNNCWPILNEWSTDHGFDRHYVYHTSWAARIIANNPPQLHIDIASDLRFSTLISAFTRVEYYDYRKLDLELGNLKIGVADLLELPFKSNSIKSISCMHVIEHIGLGRYGDPIDTTQTITRISTDEGVEGFMLGGNPEIISNVIKPMLVGENPLDREKLWNWME